MPRQKLVLENDVINGFSYSFSRALLEKLKAITKEDRIFEDSWAKALEKAHRNICSDLTSIATGTIECLENQTSYNASIGSTATPPEIIRLITYADEFLTIFETKKKKGK